MKKKKRTPMLILICLTMLLVLIPVLASFVYAVFPDSLVHYYKFEDQTGNDSITLNGVNNLVLTNGASYNSTSGIVRDSYGLNCDGVNDYAITANLTQMNFGTNDFTVEMWVYPRTCAEGKHLFDTGKWDVDQGFRISTQGATSGYQMIIDAGTWLSSNNNKCELNVLKHISIVRNSTTSNNFIYYFNGTKDAVGSATNNLNENNVAFGLCRRNANADSYADFVIDEVMIWDVARTSDQIVTDMLGYTAGVSDTTPPNSSSCLVNNSIPYKNDVVLFNCTWSDNIELSGWKFYNNNSNTNSTFNTTFDSFNRSLFYYNITQNKSINVSAKFYANDTSNNWNESSSTTIKVKNTIPPTVTTFSSPTAGQYVNVNISINWTGVSDIDSDTINYYLFLNNSLVYSGTNNNWTSNVSSQGLYTYKISSYDGEEYSANSTERNFSLDFTKPTITINEPSSSTVSNNSDGFYVNFSLSDNFELFRANLTLYYSNNSIAREIRYYHDLNSSSFSDRVLANWSGLVNGNYYAEINVSDVQSQSPIMPYYDAYILDNTIRFVDTSLGVDVTATLQIFDKTKNEEIIINKQKLKHNKTKTSDNKHINYGGSYEKNLIPLGQLKDSVFKYVYHSNNNLKLRIMNDDIALIQVDTGKLRNIFWQHKSLKEKGWLIYTYYSNNDVIVEFWKTDYKDDIIDFDPLSGGNNFNGALTSTITKDTINPIVNTVSPLNNTNITSGSSYVNFTVNITETNPDKIQFWENFNTTFKLNKTVAYTSNTNFSIINASLSDGNYIWKLIINDTAGNSIDSGNYSFTLDLNTPTTKILSPTNSSSLTDEDIIFYFNVSDFSNIINCSLYINNIFNLSDNTITKNTNQTFGIFDMSNGNYNWSVYCYDVFDKEGFSGTYNFSLNSSGSGVSDTTNPTVVMLSPDNSSSTLTKSNIFTYNVSDNIWVKNCTLVVDGVEVMQDNQIEQSANNNFIYYHSLGTISWYIFCYDVNSNFGNSSSSWSLLIANPEYTGGGGGGGGSGGGDDDTANLFYFDVVNISSNDSYYLFLSSSNISSMWMINYTYNQKDKEIVVIKNNSVTNIETKFYFMQKSDSGVWEARIRSNIPLTDCKVGENNCLLNDKGEIVIKKNIGYENRLTYYDNVSIYLKTFDNRFANIFFNIKVVNIGVYVQTKSFSIPTALQIPYLFELSSDNLVLGVKILPIIVLIVVGFLFYYLVFARRKKVININYG